jgi:hypothetical protein
LCLFISSRNLNMMRARRIGGVSAHFGRAGRGRDLSGAFMGGSLGAPALLPTRFPPNQIVCENEQSAMTRPRPCPLSPTCICSPCWASTRSYTQAARRLGISKASVSTRIAELERVAGVPLVRRTTRSVGLTQAGQQLTDETRGASSASPRASPASATWRASRAGWCG